MPFATRPHLLAFLPVALLFLACRPSEEWAETARAELPSPDGSFVAKEPEQKRTKNRHIPTFRRGDLTDDGRVDISDVVRLAQHLVSVEDTPPCSKTADVDDDGSVVPKDAIALLSYLFLGGDRPQVPFAECGTDPTADDLPCVSAGSCVSSTSLPVTKASTTSPTFGYGTMRENGAAARGERPLLLLLIQFSDQPFAEPDPVAFYSQRVFGPGFPNVPDYYTEVSHGNFTWFHAGTVLRWYPDDPETEGFDESTYVGYAAAREAGVLPVSTVVETCLKRLDYTFTHIAGYDVDGDGLEHHELGVLVLFSTPEYTGGGVRWTTRHVEDVHTSSGIVSFRPPFKAALLAKQAGFDPLAHELAHLLGTVDLYGPDVDQSIGLTLMAGAGGERTYYLDPWHRIQLGWTSYRLHEIPGYDRAELAGAGSWERFGRYSRPLILFDPERGADEYFIVEHRHPNLGGYDQDVVGTGLAVWYIKERRGTNRLESVPVSIKPGTDKILQSRVAPGSDDFERDGLIHRGPDDILQSTVSRDDEYRSHVLNVVLGANPCNLGDPFYDRGRSELWKGGQFHLRWWDGSGVGIALEIEELYLDYLRLSWRPSAASATCGVITQEGLGANEEGDQFGRTLAVGDFDGDGTDDLAVGAPLEELGSIQSGAVFIFNGGWSGLSPTKVLTQSGLGANEEGDRFGAAMVALNFNGDGYMDLAVAAPQEAPGSDPKSGVVFIFRGSSRGLLPHQVLTQEGADTNDRDDRFGDALSAADFNGDGYMDLAVGAPWEESDGPGGIGALAGAVYLFRGGPWRLVIEERQLIRPAALGVGTALFGSALATGDLNGDGFAELVVGAPLDSSSGSVFIFDGSSNLEWSRRLKQSNPEAGDLYGAALSVADFDQDGYDDLVVGAPHEKIGGDGASWSGWASLYRGRRSSFEPRLVRGFGQDGLSANEARDIFAQELLSADLNGDGFPELIVGAPGEAVWREQNKANSGQIFIFELADASSDLLQPAYTFWQNGVGIDEENDYFGSVLAVGDFHGDGLLELATGAYGEAPGSAPRSGAVFTFSDFRSVLRTVYP